MSDVLMANKVHQISHMEILQEGARSEPRLGRLLGHISAYDNVEQWRRDNQQQIFLAETARYQQAQIVPVPKLACQAGIIPSDPPLKVPTLALSQAVVCSQFERKKEVTVSTEEVISDSDSEDDDDKETESDDDSDNESTWSEETWTDEDPIIEFIREGTRSLLQHDAKDNTVFYREASEPALRFGEEKRP